MLGSASVESAGRSTAVRVGRSLVPLLVLLAALTAVGRASAQTIVDSRFAVDTVVSLPAYTPVGVTWAPDGRIFIWQKPGVVRIFKNGALLATPFLDIRGHVNSSHDHGMLGLALDPQFEQNGYVYLLYVYEGDPANPSAPKTGRLTRVQADPANPDVALPGETVILGTINTPPCSNFPDGSDCIGFDGDSHSAGSLRFGSDGTLFASIGDGAPWQQADPLALRAQDLNRYNGKILRINTDGTAPTDNPFYDGTNSVKSKVYDYGLRNPYRFSLDPATGEPIIGDVGWASREELDYGKGQDFGWPCYEGDVQRPEFAAMSPICANMPPSGQTFGVYTYPHTQPSQAVVGGVVYGGTAYPAPYQGSYFFADYGASWIMYGQLDTANNVLSNVQTFGTNMDDPVDLEMGPDGSLYYVSFTTGQLRRIRFTGATPPTAVASAQPPYGYSPLAVQFSSAGSASPDGSPLTYLWDFGDGTTSTLPNPAHTYTSPTVATFNALLRVTIGNRGKPGRTSRSSGSASAPVRIVVGSLPPTATITSPANGVVVHPGDTLSFAATASDPDETLPPSAYSWTILLHHNSHVHVDTTASGPTGSFLVEDHGTGTFYYQLVLTVTDSSGLSATRTVSTAVVLSNALVRINAGGPAYTDSLGQLWSADTGFNGGNVDSTTDPITDLDGSPDPDAPLYQTERWSPPGPPELVYSFPVPNGSYRVDLYFAEILSGVAFVGGRVFNVYIQGTQVLQNLDIFAQVGFETPLASSFTTSVTNGVLAISFGHVVDNPKISAIAIIPISAPPPPSPPPGVFRANAGGPAFVDTNGNSRDADRHNAGNAPTFGMPSTGPDPQLYVTERRDPSAAPRLNYTFPVSPGTYTVNLHFAEAHFQSAGARQFAVNINGTNVLDHLDIYAQVGFMQPLAKSFTVNVKGNAISIDFVHQIESPTISGIEIIPH